MSETVRSSLTVRYAETDAMGVVYYANYLVYFEVGRSDFFRAVGLEYAQLEEQGILAPCIEANCRYLSPARYADQLELETSLQALPGARLVFAYHLRCPQREKSIARGSTTHVCVDANGRPLALKRSHPVLWQRLLQALGN